MPFEDGHWDDADPKSADSTSLESTSGPGVAPEKVLYDEDDYGDASPSVQGPHPDNQAIDPSAEADSPTAHDQSSQREPLPEFDDRVKQDFEGLMYLGYLEHEFTWVGHTFKIRTLTSGEIIEVGLIHKPYRGTLADVKAYQAAVVAACTMLVDDQPIAVPLTNDVNDTAVRSKFNYVLRKWFPPTLDAVYEQYLLLETRVREVLDAMGKAPGSTQLTPTSNGTSA